jgi:shikimate kinase
MEWPRHVVLVGLMGAGKTTIGVPLARALGRPYRDNDTDLQRRTGLTAHDLAAAEGMDELHREEAATLVAALGEVAPLVISAPASAVADPAALKQMESVFVVWLDPEPDRLADRFSGAGYRPEIGDDARAFFEAQFAARAPLYREIADLVVQPATGESVERIVQRIADDVRRAETDDRDRRQ